MRSAKRRLTWPEPGEAVLPIAGALSALAILLMLLVA
jgi:hypothetical protein